MTWILDFEAPRGQAVCRYFWGCQVWDFREPDMWWCDAAGKFLNNDDEVLRKNSHGNMSRPIRTLRAFKRFLKKHDELKGRKVLLVNRYIGYNVTAEWEAKVPDFI